MLDPLRRVFQGRQRSSSPSTSSMLIRRPRPRMWQPSCWQLCRRLGWSVAYTGSGALKLIEALLMTPSQVPWGPSGKSPWWASALRHSWSWSHCTPCTRTALTSQHWPPAGNCTSLSSQHRWPPAQPAPAPSCSAVRTPQAQPASRSRHPWPPAQPTAPAMTRAFTSLCRWS